MPIPSFSPVLRRFRDQFSSVRFKRYLNHAGCSPYSDRVRKAIDDYVSESAGELTEDYPKNIAVREELRKKLGLLVRTEPDNIAITKNTSLGLSLLASGLDWKAGDRIILIDQEFPSNIYPFLNCRRHGAEIDFVKSRSQRNGRILTEDIEKLIQPRTRLLSISFVEFLTGFRNDLKAIGDLCAGNNILFCVDGIQGLGALELDVQECRIGFLAAAAHKWLMGPQGTGFVYVRPDLLEQIVMTQVGWLSVKDAWNFFDYRLEWENGARRFEAGTENWPGVYGFRESLSLLLETGIGNIEKHVLSLTDILFRKSGELHLDILSSPEPAHRSGIVTFRLHNDPSSARTKNLFDFLTERKIITAYREGYIRVSPHGYNSPEDMEQLTGAIQEFLNPEKYGRTENHADRA